LYIDAQSFIAVHQDSRLRPYYTWLPKVEKWLYSVPGVKPGSIFNIKILLGKVSELEGSKAYKICNILDNSRTSLTRLNRLHTSWKVNLSMCIGRGGGPAAELLLDPSNLREALETVDSFLEDELQRIRLQREAGALTTAAYGHYFVDFHSATQKVLLVVHNLVERQRERERLSRAHKPD
jgi:hypothetical protein